MGLEDAANEVDIAITRDDPKGLGYENVFAGVPSFLRRKLTKELSGFNIAVTRPSRIDPAPALVRAHCGRPPRRWQAILRTVGGSALWRSSSS